MYKLLEVKKFCKRKIVKTKVLKSTILTSLIVLVLNLSSPACSFCEFSIKTLNSLFFSFSLTTSSLEYPRSQRLHSMSLIRFTQEVSLFFASPVCLLHPRFLFRPDEFIRKTYEQIALIVLDYHESIFAIENS